MKRMKQQLRTFMNNVKLRPKFWFIIFSLSLISCSIILSYSFIVFKNYDELLYENTSQLLNMSKNNIEYDLLRVEEVSGNIVIHPLIQSALKIQSPDDAKANNAEPNARIKAPTLSYNIAASNIYNVLFSQLNQNSDIISLAIYFEDQHINVGEDSKEILSGLHSNIIDAYKQANGRPIWISSGLDDFSVISIREIKGMQPFTLKTLGTLVVRIDLQRIIARHLQQNPNLTYSPQLTLQSATEMIYTDLVTTAEQEFEQNEGYNIMSLEEGKFFVTHANQSRFNWHYTMIIPFDNVVGSLAKLRWIALLVGMLMIIISMVLAAGWVSGITRDFKVLIEKMHTFKKGNFNLKDDQRYMHRKDELGLIHQSFHRMANDIQYLVEDNYLKQLLIKDAQIKALQQQLEPHFLFNILQTINWEAKANGQKTISTMLEALGRLLRYSISEHSEIVSLKQELEVTESYIALQTHRYQERLSVQIDLPESLHKFKVPKLALQNLVENCIKHALEHMMSPCKIKIYAKENEQMFSLFVEDNGPGIDVNILEKLHRNETNETSLGIGLHNIEQRIKLLFAKGCGLYLYNTGGGTIVEMHITKERI